MSSLPGKVVFAVGTCRRNMGFAERVFLCFLRNERERHCIYTSGMIQPTSRQGHFGALDAGASGQMVIGW